MRKAFACLPPQLGLAVPRARSLWRVDAQKPDAPHESLVLDGDRVAVDDREHPHSRRIAAAEGPFDPIDERTVRAEAAKGEKNRA